MVTSRRPAKDIMTSRVYTVRPADPLWKVTDGICRHRVSGVPEVIRVRRPPAVPAQPGTPRSRSTKAWWTGIWDPS